MNCHTCGYALWNLRARQCPECGRGFRPSDYRFVANTVRFHCPHCEQAYFGTDEHGLPSPRAFECIGCKKRIELDELVLTPAESVREDQTAQGNVPWIDRRNRGRIRAYLLTVGTALTRPHRMMRHLPLNAPTGDILTFGMVTTTLALLAGVLPIFWFYLWEEYWWYYDGVEMVIFFGTYFLGSLIVAAGCVPVFAILTHIGLRLTGGCAYGADRTFQAFGAAAGASVACAVPVCGWVLGWFWWAGSTIAAVAAAQRVHVARAALAVLLLPLLMTGSLITVGVWRQLEYMTMWSGWDDPAYHMNSALSQFLWQGGEPVHALELYYFSAWEVDPRQSGRPFCHPTTRTAPNRIAVGDVTLADLLTMDRRQRLSAIQNHVDAQPANVIAHRFGDYVFTYHGGPINSGDSQFWTLVMLPDPEANGPPIVSTEIVIGHGDHTMKSITYAELAAELAAQNAYRRGLGLSPLPDLVTITHENPALKPEEVEDDDSDE